MTRRRYMPAALAPKAAASTQTNAAELEAAQVLLESLQLEDSSPAPTAQQPAGGQQEAPGLAVRKAYSTNPFAVSGRCYIVLAWLYGVAIGNIQRC